MDVMDNRQVVLDTVLSIPCKGKIVLQSSTGTRVEGATIKDAMQKLTRDVFLEPGKEEDYRQMKAQLMRLIMKNANRAYLMIKEDSIASFELETNPDA
jgi:hypothetical protein